MTSRSMSFWNTHALPNYSEYQGRRTDIRLAMNAALSAFHMADWVAAEYRFSDPSKLRGHTDLGEYRRNVLCVEFPDFNWLEGVANAHKHLWLGRKLAAHEQFEQSATETYFAGGVILTKRDDGTEVDFGPVLDGAVAMWERLIAKDGL